MFNKYWREYPWFLQLIQFVLLVFICVSFFTVIVAFIIPMLTGVGLLDMQSMTVDTAPSVRIKILLAQAIGHAGYFLVPSFMFAYAVHPEPLAYLGVRKPQDNKQWLIVLLVALAAVPTVAGIAGLLDQIPLSEGLTASKEKFAAQQKALLNITTQGELWMGILVIAVIPAIGEEFLFRGIIMKFCAKRMKGNIVWPILLSSVLFASMHFNVVGMVSLIIAGLTLGYVYYLTGSLVLSIFAHFIVNGSQVVLTYMATDNAALKAFSDSNETPWGIFIAGVALFAGSFYWLYQNRTPLRATWTNDFTNEELEARTIEQNNNSL